MNVKKSQLIMVLFSILVLLNISFPLSTYIKILCLFSFSLYMISTRFSKYWNQLNTYILLCVLFCIWASVSIFWSSYAEGVYEQLINLYLAILTGISVAIHISNYNENICDIYEWLFPVIVIYLLQSVLSGKWNDSMRFSATLSLNQYAICMSYIYLLSVYIAKTKARNRPLNYLVSFISIVMILLTGSRKALFNLLFFTCMVFMFSKYDKNLLKTVTKIFLALVVVLLFLIAALNIDIFYDAMGNRLISLLEYLRGDVEQDLSALRRGYMKKDSIDLFLQHPVHGIGLNNFKYIARYGTYAHSNYYELLCCLGIVGFLLYYVPIAMVTIVTLRQWKSNIPDAVIPFSIVITFFVNDFNNVSYMYRIIHLFLGIGVGMAFAKNREIK